MAVLPRAQVPTEFPCLPSAHLVLHTPPTELRVYPTVGLADLAFVSPFLSYS